MVETMRRVLGGYFQTLRDDALEKEIDRLLEGAARSDAAREQGKAVGRLNEGRALVVMGAAGAGKTRALERAFDKRAEFASFRDPDADCPLVSISAPSPCTLKQLGLSLLKGLGYETDRDMRENIAWEKVRHQLRARCVRFVHIDEAQHAIEFMHRHERQKVSDTLKDIMHGAGWPVWLILSGLPSFANFVEEDGQLRRRCRFLRFEGLCVSDDVSLIQRLIREYTDRAGVGSNDVLSDELAMRVIHASSNQLGISVELVQDAVDECLASNEVALEIRHFAIAYGARTGCEQIHNIFVAPDWDRLDPNRTLYQPAEDKEGIFAVAKTRQRRKAGGR